MIYELMELTTGNLVAVFDTEDAALQSVRRDYERLGRDGVITLGLASWAEDESGEHIASGEDLLARALAVAVAASS